MKMRAREQAARASKIKGVGGGEGAGEKRREEERLSEKQRETETSCCPLFAFLPHFSSPATTLHFPFLSLFLSLFPLSIAQSPFHTRTRARALSNTHTHTFSLSLFLSLPPSLSLPLSLSPPSSLSLTLSCARWFCRQAPLLDLREATSHDYPGRRKTHQDRIRRAQSCCQAATWT